MPPADFDIAATTVNRRWVLAERPIGRAVRESDFRLVEAPLPALGPGEFLIRTLYLSVLRRHSELNWPIGRRSPR